MAGCGKLIKAYVPKGFDYKEIDVKCGSTSPDGNPYLCPTCEKEHEGTDWRHEAEMNGEAWGEDDY
jgi:hypothetical protein